MSREEKFEEIYNRIVKENSECMENMRKEASEETKRQIKKLIIIPIAMLGMYLLPKSIRWIYALAFFMLFIYRSYKLAHKNGESKEGQYIKAYKDKIIKTIIKSFDDKLEYIPQEGIAPNDFNEAEFESYDKYESEDLVQGKLENGCKFSMAEVLTKNRHKDSDRRYRVLNCI